MARQDNNLPPQACATLAETSVAAPHLAQALQGRVHVASIAQVHQARREDGAALSQVLRERSNQPEVQRRRQRRRHRPCIRAAMVVTGVRSWRHESAKKNPVQVRETIPIRCGAPLPSHACCATPTRVRHTAIQRTPQTRGREGFRPLPAFQEIPSI